MVTEQTLIVVTTGWLGSGPPGKPGDIKRELLELTFSPDLKLISLRGWRGDSGS